LENVEIAIDGNRVVISFDVTNEGELSSTGKTRLVASTRGNVQVEHPECPGLKVSLNAGYPVKG
jgi:hypothetical protein